MLPEATVFIFFLGKMPAPLVVGGAGTISMLPEATVFIFFLCKMPSPLEVGGAPESGTISMLPEATVFIFFLGKMPAPLEVGGAGGPQGGPLRVLHQVGLQETGVSRGVKVSTAKRCACIAQRSGFIQFASLKSNCFTEPRSGYRIID